MGILYILLGSAFGAIITYLRMNNTPTDNDDLQKLKQKGKALDLRVKSGEEKHQRFEEELKSTKEAFDQRERDLAAIKDQLKVPVIINPAKGLISQTETPIINRSDEVQRLEKQVKVLSIEKSELETEKTNLGEENLQMAKRMENLEKNLKERTTECNEVNYSLSKEKEEHQASKKMLKDQRTSIQLLGKKFNSDFQNMGIKTLEELESRQKNR